MKSRFASYLVRSSLLVVLMMGLVDCTPPVITSVDPIRGTRVSCTEAWTAVQPCHCGSDFCRCGCVNEVIYVGASAPSPALRFFHIPCMGAQTFPGITAGQLLAQCEVTYSSN